MHGKDKRGNVAVKKFIYAPAPKSETARTEKVNPENAGVKKFRYIPAPLSQAVTNEKADSGNVGVKKFHYVSARTEIDETAGHTDSHSNQKGSICIIKKKPLPYEKSVTYTDVPHCLNCL